MYVAETAPLMVSTPRNTSADSVATATSNVGRTYFSNTNEAGAAEIARDGVEMESPSPVSRNDASTNQSPKVGSLEVGRDALATP